MEHIKYNDIPKKEWYTVTWFDRILDERVSKSNLTHEQALDLVRKVAITPLFYYGATIHKQV